MDLKQIDTALRRSIPRGTPSRHIDDAIQEVLISLWRRKETGKPIENLAGYLHSSLRRALIKVGKGDLASSIRDLDTLPHPAPSPEKQTERQDYLEHIWSELERTMPVACATWQTSNQALHRLRKKVIKSTQGE